MDYKLKLRYNLRVIKQHSFGEIEWYDLESPTPEEIKKLSVVYKLDPLVEHELYYPTLKPKVDVYENSLYVILHFPVFHPITGDEKREMDFVIGKNFLITTHYERLDSLQGFADTVNSRDPIFTKKDNAHGGHLFFAIIHHLYNSMLLELDIVDKVLDKAEKNLFDGNEKGMLISLSKTNRDLLDYKNATNLHKSVWESFEKVALEFFEKDYSLYVNQILNDFYKVHSAIQENKDYLEELRRTNDSLLSNKQNEIMKTVTVLAFIFLPLSLVASVFGMNIEDMPFVKMPHAFPIITGSMAILALFILLLARHNEWL